MRGSTCRPNRFAYPIRVVFRQVWVHGEAEALAGDLLGDREVAGLVAEPGEYRLEVQGDGVVADGRDLGGLEGGLQGVALRGEDRVLGVDGGVPLAKAGEC